jgi:ABC-type sugar transport system ATPase subunit
MTAALEAHHLSRTFAHYQALEAVDITLQPGEVVILQGSIGAGNSTLLHCLSRLLPTDCDEP